jgi:hypothetical protein
MRILECGMRNPDKRLREDQRQTQNRKDAPVKQGQKRASLGRLERSGRLNRIEKVL